MSKIDKNKLTVFPKAPRPFDVVSPADAPMHAAGDSMTFKRYAGHNVIKALMTVALRHGAGAAEFAAIRRLEEGRAEQVDVERLEPLAKLADLPWQSLFPEVAR